MENNKILIELEIPLIEVKYDIKSLIENSLIELTDKAYIPRQDTNLYSKETGEIYDVNKTIRDTDLKNGSRIILI